MIKKVAVLKGPGIGDITTSAPLLRNLKQALPGSEIVLFNETGYGAGRTLLQDCPYVDKIIELNQKKGPIQLLRKVREVRKEKFDVIIDSYPSTYKTALFCFLSGAKMRCGYTTNPLSFLYTISVNPGNRNLVNVEEDILKRLGIEPDSKGLEVFLDIDSSKSKVEEFLKNNGITEDDFLVAVHTGRTNDKTRTWPSDRWAELCDTLINRGAKLIFIGSEMDSKRTSEVMSLMKNKAMNFVGPRTLEETASVLLRANLCITIDGGIMHLSSALKRPLVALCGYTKPGWYPYGNKNVVIKKNPEKHKDLQNYTKEDNSEMLAISVSDVIDAIRNNVEKLRE